jgi:hypothetical protein
MENGHGTRWKQKYLKGGVLYPEILGFSWDEHCNKCGKSNWILRYENYRQHRDSNGIPTVTWVCGSCGYELKEVPQNENKPK